MELVAILVVGQANLAAHEVQEVLEVHKVRKELQDHQRRLAEMNNWFHLLLRFRVQSVGLTSRNFLPEHNHCPLTRIKCGTETLNWATGQTLTPNWS